MINGIHNLFIDKLATIPANHIQIKKEKLTPRTKKQICLSYQNEKGETNS